MALLARQDPILDQILFYEDVPLFEDELHDNGESILNARIVSLSVLLLCWAHEELTILANHAAFALRPRQTVPSGRQCPFQDV
jgi:hypothetical protein